ncbi:NAC domain-containing protein 16 [Cardamine amara subsp. amara]|uniref:NAC domain-containing protein 16 n=1 Tax=Cardamine amara subsp. amara TaxID=228776 RepID=A0ABD1BR49_CARAN
MAESSPDSCFKGGKFSAPGFRFHPTDEELVMYYLKRKICSKKLRINVIGVVDVYKLDPEELPGQSMLKTGDKQWFYFTPRNRKYPNAARSGRGTATGYWKATGKDRIIEYNSRSVGLKKTLVFYRGRAPSGERTDWVMHEYTMDEDELGRCKNVKDYYALYKLFKKSGAGPKNGEQYGAPFQEKEWVDSDSEDAEDVAVPDEPVVHYENGCRRVDDTIFCNPVNVQLDDIEKLLNDIPVAPEVAARQINEYAGVYQGNGKEEIQSTLLNNYSGEFLVSPEIGEFYPNGQPPYDRHLSIQSHLRSVNSFEATSSIAPSVVFQKEDYIEMDDLLIPELGASSSEKSAEGTSTDLSFMSNFANNTSDQRQQFLYQQFQDQTPVNQLNNFVDPSTTLNQFTDDMLFKGDDQADPFYQPQPTSGAPSAGLMLESTNPTMSVNAQDHEGQNGGETKSQFSSALWEFLESIPSTPASACEGPLNKTFVRMSSLSRIRFNGTSVTTSKVTKAKKRIRNRGFLLLSVMGALCAILWVFIATVGALRRPVFS